MALRADATSHVDAVTFLEQEHAAVEKLFVDFEAAGSLSRKDPIIGSIVRELRLHAAMEEAAFYPSIRLVLADGERLVAEAIQEHQAAKQELLEIEGMSTDAPALRSRMARLISDVRHHVHEEEGDMLPKLRRAVGETWLRELGDELRRTKQRLAGQDVQEPTIELEPGSAVLTLEGPPSMRAAQTRVGASRGKRPATKRSTARTSTARKSAAKKPTARKSTAKSTARTSTAKKSTARKSTAKSTARTSTAKKSTAKRSTASPSTARKSTAKKSTARTSTAKKSTARKSTARKSTARKSTGREIYHVKPASDGRWQVSRRGAARASSTHDRKTEAVARGKQLARKPALGQLVVHTSDGKIQQEFTYGADPRRTKG